MQETLSMPRRRIKVFLQGQVVIPDWVDDLDFRRWRFSKDVPDQGEIAFLDNGWIASKVLGKEFQLQRKSDPLGHPQFVVAVGD